MNPHNLLKLPYNFQPILLRFIIYFNEECENFCNLSSILRRRTIFRAYTDL